MELVPFSDIEDDWDNEGNWTVEQKEAASFLGTLDYEGGIAGLLSYDTAAFPKELQDLAVRTLMAIEHLSNAVNAWAAARGVSY